DSQCGGPARHREWARFPTRALPTARIGAELRNGERLTPHGEHDAAAPGAIERRPVRVAERSHIDIRGDGADARIGLVDLHGRSQIGRAHVVTPVTSLTRTPSSAAET